MPSVIIVKQYEVKFILPNGEIVKFVTGPNGSFSVYNLWLNMRILCANKGEVNRKPPSQSTSSNNYFRNKETLQDTMQNILNFDLRR